jgi:hypothetical protein
VAAGDRVQGAIRIGDRAMPFGPVSGVLGAEWRFDPAAMQSLLGLSAASGGQSRLDLSGVWEHEPRRQWKGTAMLWLIAAGILFLFEAIWDRLGGRKLEWDWERGKRWKEKRNLRKEQQEKPEESGKPKPPEPDAAPRRRSAFQQARHRSRR